MKKSIIPVVVVMISLLTFSFIPFGKKADALTGAWGINENGREVTVVCQDGYASVSVFNKASRQFIYTYGGPYQLVNDQLRITVEYHTSDKSAIGTVWEGTIAVKKDAIQLQIEGASKLLKRIDDGTGGLAGNWRITGRMQGDKMGEIQRSDRKTLKLLSGTRFQWMAINPATKEFFGTGGGYYTFNDGKYTEHIEFFSRDSSRVGAVLSFDGKVAGDKWEHSGKSSKGDPIFEIWSREK